MQTTLYSNVRSLFVDVPLLVQYSPFKNQFFISSGLELSFGLYNNYKSAYQSYDGTITKINASKFGEGFTIFLPVSLGFNIPIKQQKMLSVEPGIKVLLKNRNTYDLYSGLYSLRASLYF